MCNNNNILIVDFLKLTFFEITLHMNDSYSYGNNSHINNQPYVKHTYSVIQILSVRKYSEHEKFVFPGRLYPFRIESINLKS